jgi:hypothetical protein
MRSAVDFDDELSFTTNKVREVWADRLLTHEFEAAELAIAKLGPELLFGGHIR